MCTKYWPMCLPVYLIVYREYPVYQKEYPVYLIVYFETAISGNVEALSANHGGAS